VDDVARRISFFFNAHSNFLEEVAKFRAARRLWARLVQERFRPGNERVDTRNVRTLARPQVFACAASSSSRASRKIAKPPRSTSAKITNPIA